MHETHVASFDILNTISDLTLFHADYMISYELRGRSVFLHLIRISIVV